MVYSLKMPKPLKDKGWKVKIRNWERTETPHVTILRKTVGWRYNIREPGFMDSDPDPSRVPDDVVNHITESLPLLRRQWDRKHPDNPIDSGGGEE